MQQPETGQIVHLRSRPYLVEEVVPRPDATQDTLVRLSCLADEAFAKNVVRQFRSLVDAEKLLPVGV